MTVKKRPFLKWAGGKYRLLERISKVLPKGKRLIEPFVGSGVVFLNSHYPGYLLNDINPDLINLYKVVQTDGEQFIKDASQYFNGQNNNAESYNRLREQFNQSQDTYERSLIFLYMNRHGYNGLCRYNLKGGFNVPFGRYKRPHFPEDSIRSFIEKSQDAQLSCNPFASVIDEARSGDVVYCDPPYFPLSPTSNFTSYSHQGFLLEDQQKLVTSAKAAVSRGAVVIISNHDTKLAREYYKGASLRRFKVRRNISSNPQRRDLVPELLAIYKPETD